MADQTGWRFCSKCHGLFFAGHADDQGRCPGGGTHDAGASGKYVMRFGDSQITANPQGGWRFCHKCAGLFFITGVDSQEGPTIDNPPSDKKLKPNFDRTCPAGGRHSQRQSGLYVMEFGESGPGVQGDWRFCKHCFGLFFSRPGDATGHNVESQGVCSAEGASFTHDASESGHYRMSFEPQPKPPQPPHGNPEIVVETTRFETGGEVRVFGKGFTPDGHVSIFGDNLAGAPGPEELGFSSADKEGTFVTTLPFMPFRCNPVPQRVSVIIRATDDAGGGGFATGETNASVCPF